MNGRPRITAVDFPDTHYARAHDGAYLAYQVVGEGPVDVLEQVDWPGNIDMMWEDLQCGFWYNELASFARLILHDRRGVGPPAGTSRSPT
jgi:hypothetical protein